MKAIVLMIACAASSAVADVKPPKITSKETGLYPSKACKTKIAGGEGQDPVLRCPAMKGFEVEVSFAAVTTQVSITGTTSKTDFSGLVGDKLEWRIANGKPFALLVEMADADTDDQGNPIEKNRRVEVFVLGESAPYGKVELASKKAADRRAAWAKARTLASSIVSPPTK